MTLAYRLALSGRRVTILEASDHLGGLADAWKIGDISWDRHYHVTLMSDEFLRQLLAELQLGDQMQWVETKTGFFTDGQLYSMSNTIEFLKFPPLGLIDKFRLGATIFYAARIRNWKKLEKIKVADWLRRLSGNRTFEKIWLPLLRAKLGSNYKITSAAFIWATIARMYAARRTGLKKEMFGYVKGGYRHILDRFENRLREMDVRISVSHRVTDIRREAGRFKLTSTSGDSHSFDRLVMTVPSNIIAQVLPQLTETELQRFRGVQYQGVICASLLLKKSLSPYYVTNITESNIPFTGVIEMSNLVSSDMLGGNYLVYLPKYVPADDDSSFAISDEDIRGQFIEGLSRMHPDLQETDIVAFRVSRVRQVMAIPTLNYSETVPSHLTSIPGLYVVNSSQICNGTLNVNENVKLANSAIELIQNHEQEAERPVSSSPTAVSLTSG